MRNYLAIVKKDLHTLFVSPVAYVVLAVFFGLSGFFFNVITEGIIDQVSMMSFQSQQFGQAPEPIDVPALILRNFFGLITLPQVIPCRGNEAALWPSGRRRALDQASLQGIPSTDRAGTGFDPQTGSADSGRTDRRT